MIHKFIAFFLIVAVNCSKMKVIWEENFNGNSIDQTKFTFDIGTGEGGWGNNELQYYTNRSENARVKNGNLIIEARREDFEGSAFTSARLKTNGLQEFKFGTLEARIKLPSQRKGLWPAFWTLGANIDQVGWPNCGEIDILETGSADAIANNAVNNQVGGASHWENQAMYHTFYKTDFNLSADFHVYKLEWTNFAIIAFIDGIEYFRMNIPTETFRRPHFMLLNLAVGGRYTGISDPAKIDANFPAQMRIDWIKLYQKTSDIQKEKSSRNGITQNYINTHCNFFKHFIKCKNEE